jgi:hypothetical protein
MGLMQPFLTGNIELRQQDVPTVAQQFIIGHAHASAGTRVEVIIMESITPP